MFRTGTNFDKLLDKATSNLRLDPDWPAILQICDLIRQNDCSPKYAVAAIKKKLYSPNPHQAMFALLVLESIVKNCGSGVHDEITSKANCEMFRELVKSSQHENVRTKTLELIQAWAFAFRNNSKYRAVQDTVNIMKAEGYKFPVLKESDAMFSADSAPEWSDGDVCHRCRVLFSLMQRKHHCRACGQVFCQQCSAKTTTLPKFGIEKEVRVCDACYDQVSRPPGPGTPAKSDPASESTVDYVTSALAQQGQPQPGQKTAEELQEEEELQLALALSQSEAEQKEKDRQRMAPVTQVVVPAPQHQTHSSPPGSAPPAELSRYLDRGYWEQRVQTPSSLQEPPSAPTPSPGPQPPSSAGLNDMLASKIASMKLENGAATDPEMEEFITALKSQVEIFVNRMKSNSSRGRSIANDSSVQTLFMNITTMHSRLLRYIQQQDDSRVHYEGLQDKLTQVKDSRAALDVLREEHAERMRRAAEQAERQRQLQMAHKLDIMRKKKQEYLQYQRQLALQRVQEQEREMQMRQEQQKHQYMMGGSGVYYLQGSPVHQFHPGQQAYQPPPYAPGYPPMMGAQPGMIRQPGPQGMPQHNLQQGQMGHLPQLNMQGQPMNQQGQPLNQQGQPMNQQGQPMGQHPGGMPPPGGILGQQVPQGPQMGIPISQHGPQGPQQMNQQNPMGMPGSQSQMSIPGSQQMQQGQMVGPQGAQMPQQNPQMNQQLPQHGQMPQMNQQGQQMNPQGQQMNSQGQQMNPQGPQMNQQGPQLNQQGQPMNQQGPQMNQQGMPQHVHQMGQMPQQLGQQMGQPRPQNFPQQGQIPQLGQGPQQMGPPLNQNMPPGHQQQSMPHMGQNQQMMGHPQQINQGQHQTPMPQGNQMPNNPAADTKLGSLSPTSTPSNTVSAQAPPLSMVGPQNSQGSPLQQKPVVQENPTAELITFD